MAAVGLAVLRGSWAFAAPPSGVPKLKLGEELEGTVKVIMPFGVIFKVDKGGSERDGMAHVSELSNAYVSNIGGMFAIGDKVKVKVISISEAKLSLSVKQAGLKPMSEFVIGEEVKGTVTRVLKWGAYVDVGVAGKGGKPKDAILHCSQLKDDDSRVDDVREFLEVGDKIAARIKSKEDGKIEVTMRSPQQPSAAPLVQIKMDSLAIGEEMGGRVSNIVDFGVFVDVGAEADGLVHIRNFPHNTLSDLSQYVKRGDGLIVKVLAMKSQKNPVGKLELELACPLPRLPDVDSFLDVPKETLLEGKIAFVAEIGVLVELTPPGGGPTVTGFLGKAQLANEDELGFLTQAIGEPIKVRILRVDPQQKQIYLTTRAPRQDAKA